MIASIGMTADPLMQWPVCARNMDGTGDLTLKRVSSLRMLGGRSNDEIQNQRGQHCRLCKIHYGWTRIWDYHGISYQFCISNVIVFCEKHRSVFHRLVVVGAIFIQVQSPADGDDKLSAGREEVHNGYP